MNVSLLTNLALNGVALGMLFFLMASGLSMIFGLMGVLNLAHGSLFMWGTYVGFTIYRLTDSFALALAVGTLAGAVLGVTMERLLFRPLYARPVMQILLSIGLIFILDEAVRVIWGVNLKVFTVPAALQGSAAILGRSLAHYKIFVIVLGALVWLGGRAALERSRVGMVIRGAVENRRLIQALGWDVDRIFTQVFAAGGALAALGGVAAGPIVGVHPALGMKYMLSAVVVVVIGGIGSYGGTAVGALLVGLSYSLLGYYLPQAAVGVNLALMVLILLVRPLGLFGVERGHGL